MKSVIWKYPINVSSEPTIHNVPIGAQVLHVADQGGLPTIWMKVNPEAEVRPRSFVVVGTGNSILTEYNYIGTAVGSIFVWHIWEFI